MTTAPDPLTPDAVRKVARLARLELDDAHVESYQHDLSRILTYIDRLRALDLDDVEPMSHPIEATNRLDSDDPAPALPNSALMNIAPDTLPPFIKVPKVLDDGGGA